MKFSILVTTAIAFFASVALAMDEDGSQRCKACKDDYYACIAVRLAISQFSQSRELRTD
jgi:hypothetical protein